MGVSSRACFHPSSKMGDDFMGMDDETQTKCLGCFGCGGLASFIIFLVFITNYAYLGPDDQVLLRKGRNFSTINGPWSGQLKPTQWKEFRKAIVLEGTEYALIKETKTQFLSMQLGPLKYFLGPKEELVRKGTKLVLEVGEYIRYVSTRTGQERIVEGPRSIAPSATETAIRGVEKAVSLNDEQAVMVWDKGTAAISLITECTHSRGIFVPTKRQEILQMVNKFHLAPHQAVVIKAPSGTLQIVKGTEIAPPEACDNSSDVTAAGMAFFMKPYFKIMRMSWSNHSVMPEDPVLTSGSVVNTARRRRTSRNEIIISQVFSTRPKYWLVPGDFDVLRSNTWPNRGWGGNVAVVKRGTLLVRPDGSGGGAMASLAMLEGYTSSDISFGSIVPPRFTICSMTRYTGSAKQRILTGETEAGWYHGHYLGHAGVASYNTAATQIKKDAIVPDTDWLPMCGTNQGTTPNDIMVGNSFVGTKASNARLAAPSKLGINKRTEKSDFGLAELIIFDRALGKDEMMEVMAYFQRRLQDASMYMDQRVSASNVQAQAEKYRLATIDQRMQKSFYKFQVRTADEIKVQIEGTIFWQIEDVGKMFAKTGDPEGDVWLMTRSALISIMGNTTWGEFSQYSTALIDQGFQNFNASFFTERGLNLDSVELSKYEPVTPRVIASLRTNLEQNVNGLKLMEQQRSREEVTQANLSSSIALEANKTILIERKAENDRLLAATIGSTEGGRKAEMLSSFLKSLRERLSNESAMGVVRNHLKRKASVKDAHHLGNASAKIFVVKKTMNLSMLLPHNVGGAATRELSKEDNTGHVSEL